MSALLFHHPQDVALATALAMQGGMEKGDLALRAFPDGETYLRFLPPVAGRTVYFLCSLNDPNAKINLLLFFAKTARALGATSVTLIAPYLGYMRQDKAFHEGEAVTADIHAAFLSSCFDRIITIDPHLHRHARMEEIFSIPSCVVHAAPLLAQWVKTNVASPLLIGPDAESEQWVRALAEACAAPYHCLQKNRLGDRTVILSALPPAILVGRTPVLVDDMISTAGTMVEVVKQLKKLGVAAPVCVAIHPLFAGDAYARLKEAGAGPIVSCNTVPHASNAMDVAPLLVAVLENSDVIKT